MNKGVEASGLVYDYSRCLGLGTKISLGLKKTGIVFMALGMLSVFLVLFRVDDNAVYNIGIFNESRYSVYLSVILCLAGSLSFGLGMFQNEETTNLMDFAFWVFGLPVSFLLSFKVVPYLIGMVLAFFVRWIH